MIAKESVPNVSFYFPFFFGDESTNIIREKKGVKKVAQSIQGVYYRYLNAYTK